MITAISPSEPRSREIILAMPSTMANDMYRVHQQVWREVVRCARAYGSHAATSRFLFRVDSDAARVVLRSQTLQGPRVRTVQFDPSRDIHVDLAAVRRTQDGQRPIEDVHVPDWCRAQLSQAGLCVKELGWVREWRVGTKPIEGRSALSISLPVVRVAARAAVIDIRALAHAWHAGVGRAKGFGIGMLTQ